MRSAGSSCRATVTYRYIPLQRWFELQGGVLSYLKEKGDAIPRGAVDLRGASVIEAGGRYVPLHTSWAP